VGNRRTHGTSRRHVPDAQVCRVPASTTATYQFSHVGRIGVGSYLWCMGVVRAVSLRWSQTVKAPARTGPCTVIEAKAPS
jgi:hypothetical protein